MNNLNNHEQSANNQIIDDVKIVGSEKKCRQRSFFFATESISEVKIEKKNLRLSPFFMNMRLSVIILLHIHGLSKRKGTFMGPLKGPSDLHRIFTVI